MNDTVTMTPEERLATIRDRAEAATGTAWHWAGNTDTGEPYLATWLPGYGRCQILSLVQDDREITSWDGRRVRDEIAEYLNDDDEIAASLDEWAEGKDTRLAFLGPDVILQRARDMVVYEVAPHAVTREDPSVYRADITGIRHPDADFIAHSRADVAFLLAEVDRLTALVPTTKES